MPPSATSSRQQHGSVLSHTHSDSLCPPLCCLTAACVAGPPVPSSARQSVLSPRASAAGPGFELGEEGETWGVQVTEQDRAVWAAQEAMAERLPMVSIRRVLLDSIMLWTVGSCTVVHVSLDASAAAAGFEFRRGG